MTSPAGVIRLDHYYSDTRKLARSRGMPLDYVEPFGGQIVGLTGNGPLDAERLRQEIILAGGLALLANPRVWQVEQLIVVGREDFDAHYLQETVRQGLHGVGSNREYRFVYLSQEDFAAWWIGGAAASYSQDDPRIRKHPGLTFLASIGFRWPSTAGGPGLGTPGGARRLQDEHPLLSVYHYSVRQDVRIQDRRAALQRAIRPDALGLEVVAEHIAWLVRWNKARRDSRMEGAIERWEADLVWLQDSYYKLSIYRFIWPEY